MTNLEQYARCVQTETWWGYFFCRGCEACPAQTYCHAQPSGTCCRENFLQWAGEETAEPPNDPLTLEELRGMLGNWVWVIVKYRHADCQGWALVAPGCLAFLEHMIPFNFYGNKVVAYRRKPDGGVE